jgi:hypothetical protein
MATEPERPIEKLLRGVARRRREEARASFELHPATRRLLQSEVTRHFNRPGSRARPFSFGALKSWPRLAWGLGFVTVLAITAVILLSLRKGDKSETYYASNKLASEQPSRSVSSRAPQPTPAAAAIQPAEAPPRPPTADFSAANLGEPGRKGFSSEIALSKSAAVAEKQAPIMLDVQSHADRDATTTFSDAASAALTWDNTTSAANSVLALNSIPPKPDSTLFSFGAGANVTTNAMVEMEALRARFSVASSAAPSLAAASAPVAPLPPARRSLTVATDEAAAVALLKKEDKSQPSYQHFVRAEQKAKDVVADRLASQNPVLSSFQIQRLGRQVRVIDWDGSVYSGTLYTEPANGRATAVQHAFRDAVGGAPAGGLPSLQQKINSQSNIASAQQGQPETVPAYSFRVSGTNLTLKEQVVFTGHFLAPIDTESDRHSVAPSNRPVTSGLAGSAAPQNYQASRIFGQAVVAGKTLDINVVPTNSPPP